VRADSRYTPTTSMIAVEQTSNFGGGTVWPLETIRAIAEVARRHELALHTGLTADQVAERLADHGVRIGPMGEDLMRAVTHLDVTTEQVAKAAAAVRAVVEAA
jgi:threonine aldolase